MQNAKVKCGLTEEQKGMYRDDITSEAYVWYEQQWQHDDYVHLHSRAQLTYVKEGYQYIHTEKHIYLVPQHHVAWIPASTSHRTTSEASTVNLMVVLFKTPPANDFFKQVQVFPAPPILKEMLRYAAKWSKVLEVEEEQVTFLKAILSSLPSFCKESTNLQIPVPSDERLTPVCNYIHKQYATTFSIEALAMEANLSARSLQRIFKNETGITLQKYVQLIRILKSIALIDSKQYTLSEIAHMVGYKSLTAFTASYTTIMKTRPGVTQK